MYAISKVTGVNDKKKSAKQKCVSVHIHERTDMIAKHKILMTHLILNRHWENEI